MLTGLDRLQASRLSWDWAWFASARANESRHKLCDPSHSMRQMPQGKDSSKKTHAFLVGHLRTHFAPRTATGV